MKIRKTAEQKTLLLTKIIIQKLSYFQWLEKIIFCIDEVFDIRYITNINQVEDSCFRIFADMCKEVKVVYDNSFGCYKTVVITDN